MSKKILVLTTNILLLLMLTCPVCTARNLINEEVNVPALSYMSYYFDIDTDYITIELSITAYLFDISVYVMDDNNYNKWVQGQSAQVYFQRHELLDGDYSIDLGLAGVYYIVLDNTDSILSSVVKIKVSIISTAENIGIIVGVLIGVGILVYILIRANRGKKQQVAYPVIKTPDSTYVLSKPVEAGVKYCIECGSRLDLDAVFCQNCSKKQ